MKLAKLMRLSCAYGAIAAPAFAQDAAPTPVPTDGAGQEAPAGTDQAVADGSGQEIVVTAQRRSERLRDVPASLTVQTGEALERSGVDSSTNLTLAVPGLVISQGGSQTIPTMRGISSLNSSIGNDPSVVIYVDGVYQPSQSANTFDLPDVLRVEALKGPQGTLYGRNATGGVISIITREPTFTPQGAMSLSYGSFDQVIFRGRVSGPLIGDTVAGAFSVGFLDQDGYNEDLLRGGYIGRKNSLSFRGRLLFRPTDNFSVLLSAWYSESYDESGQTGNAIDGNSTGNAAGFLTPSEPWQVALDVIPFIDMSQRGASLRMNWDLGFAELTSLTAVNSNRIETFVPSEYSAQPGANYFGFKPDDMFTQDFQLASTGSGPLRWIVGGSLYRNEAFYTPFVIQAPGGNPTVYWLQVDSASWAVFGELTYSLTDRFHITAGLRYTQDEKTAYGDLVVAEPAQITERDSRSWTNLSPRVALRYELTDTTNLYFTYSEAFKSGAYNANSIGAPAVDPETVSGFEGGIKTSLFRGRLQAELAYFNYNYQNIQVSSNVGGIGRLQNAASASIEGMEASLSFRATDELSFSLGASLLDTAYGEFPGAIINVPKFLNGLPNGNANATVDLTGFPLVRSPEWTVNLTTNYLRQFETGQLDATLTIYSSAEMAYEISNRIRQPAYTLVNASVGWTFGDSNMRFGLWARNLTNEAVYNSVFINVAADGAAYAPPRQVGAIVSYSF